MTAERQFAALADPTRRAIFETLLRQPLAVGALAEAFPVSRPAVSQHLRVLKDAGLVVDERSGTQNIYRVDPQGLAALRDWLDAIWSRALGDFKHAAEQSAPRAGLRPARPPRGFKLPGKAGST